MGASCGPSTCCAGTSCGRKYASYKTLKDMNKKGVYPPNQIEEEVTSNWNKRIGKEVTFVDKDQARTIAQKTIAKLAKKGNGIKYYEDSFCQEYNKIDPMGMGQNPKASICVMMTAMMAKPGMNGFNMKEPNTGGELMLLKR